jgi:hypothetical protein
LSFFDEDDEPRRGGETARHQAGAAQEGATVIVTDNRRHFLAALRHGIRVETPADIVGTALFLASSDSDFITGQLLVVEGGGIMH